MKAKRQILGFAAALIVIFTIQGCSLGTQLRTETADPKTITGTYDLLLYGCRYPDDIEHAAFLITPDKAGMVELYVPATSYKVKRGLPAGQAFAEANTHVRCGVRTVEAIRVLRIPDGSGGTLGFEILPRYPATDLGGMDPLNVSYALKDGKITVYITLFPQVERELYRSSSGGGQ
ncbi:MAG: hypothetical protein HGB21_04235 [Nitrospirae bacterium]|nr:hypothetical protein [Nitrospirota bacterium]NTW65514.1 hypothetical protein [Nitrospirota bacterium]